MLQHAIQVALERWVENGRERDAINDGRTFVLRYGRRFKLQHVGILAVFAFSFGLGVVLLLQGDPATETTACLGLFGLLTAFSAIYVTYAFTSRVVVDDTRVTVRCFGMTISECTAETLSTAYRSPVHESVVLQSRDGRKTRISTQFDGLRSLVAWLRLRPPDTLADSVVSWMEAEAPDMDEPSERRGAADSAFGGGSVVDTVLPPGD